MDTEQKGLKGDKVNTPSVLIKNITFNDQTLLPLTNNSIVVFTGANNTGKSQVLRDIENSLNASVLSAPVVLKKCEYDFHGAIDISNFLNDNFFLNINGHYQMITENSAFSEQTLKSYWEKQTNQENR